MRSQKVSEYGIHEDPITGTRWLMEMNTKHNLIGLPDQACPFSVDKGLRCQHSFEMKKYSELEYHEDSLIQQLSQSPVFHYLKPKLPDHQDKIIYFETEDLRDIMALGRLLTMTSPIGKATNLADQGIGHAQSVLRSSNLAKYMLTGIKAAHLTVMNNMIMYVTSMPGQLLLTGERIPYFAYRGIVQFVPMNDPTFTDLVLQLSDETLKRLARHYVRQLLL